MNFPEYIEQDINPPKEYFEESPPEIEHCGICANVIEETELSEFHDNKLCHSKCYHEDMMDKHGDEINEVKL